MENIPSPQEPERGMSALQKKVVVYIAGGVALVAIFYFLFLSAPSDFPVGGILRIQPGATLRSVSLQLKNKHFIRSRAAFETFVILFGREKKIISTDYFFENRIPVYVLARRISRGEHNMAPISVTIPEGFNVSQISKSFSQHLVNFNTANFLMKAKPLEGYLFPDTYFFLTNDTEEDVIKSMTANFNKKITPLATQITAAYKKESDIVIMASIIEREAKGDDDRAMIAGILWKRISIGMPLQVDASPETYKVLGLPKNPIGNPGIEALLASIHPQKSPYLYYLHDKNGIIHYARSFSEHKANEAKYLK